PTLVRNLFALRLGRNVKRMWQDAHNAVGILSLPFHIIFAWSGAVLALGLLLLVPFQTMVYEGKLLKLLERDFYGAPQVATAHAAKPTLLQRGQAALPALEIEGISLVNIGDANARATLYGMVEQRRLNQLGSVTLD